MKTSSIFANCFMALVALAAVATQIGVASGALFTGA